MPPDEDALYWEEFERHEKVHNMPHMTSIERRAYERGLELGRAEGWAKMLLLALEKRYRVAVPDELAAHIRGTTELSLLKQWTDWMIEATSWEDFQRRMQNR